MKERKSILRRVFSGFLALAVTLSLAALALPTASAASLDELKQQAAELERQESALESQLSKLEKQAASKLEEKAVLEQQISVLSAQIVTTETLIAEYTSEIEVKQVELEEAQEKESEYYDLFCERFRDMEESRAVSYWTILFGSASFSDFLDRLNFVSQVVNYDNQIVHELEAARQAVADAKTAIETAKTEQETAMADLESQRAALEEEEAAINEVIEEIEDKASDYEDELERLESEKDALDDRIAAAQQPETSEPSTDDSQDTQEEKPQEDTGSSASGTGSMVWPCASHRITSYFGNRKRPTAGASTYHKGIDIGASKGTAIYAADSGTVTEAGYSSSRGNYIVISHGNGISTVYMHCSALYVSRGATVSKGQTIAAVGSTGISTGPHLHFSVIVNGSYVDPLNYVS